MLATLPVPSWFPSYEHEFNQYLVFKSNWAAAQALAYFLYYMAMLPSGAVSFIYLMIVCVDSKG